MLSTLAELTRDPVLHRVGLGWIAVITLDQLNALVGLLVGIATLVYLCLRIRDQLRNRNSKPSSED
ncbi:hypothetical protein IMCC26134_10490 [Verrucomicrobia bacterium IMCC26134]|nr:hypothetical protein IMCC26134_10490 [Verrucomicrobia bacterium IMCC26134]